VGALFFPRRGGLGPLFVHFEEKKEFPQNFFKKRVPAIS
jgi:hypothetical protein